MTVSREEHRWVLRFALVVMLMTMVPYIIGYAAQGQDWTFTGFLIGVEDGNSYMAKMLAGAKGDWLFRSTYTSFPQRGLMVQLPFILLGKLTAPPAQYEQMVALFHLFRFVAGVLVCLAVYDFISLFIGQSYLRRWGLALAVLGGGLGWLLVLLGQNDLYGALPLDLYSPESFGFLMLFGIPHLTFARSLLLWGFVKYLSPQPKGVERRDVYRFNRTGAKTGLLWLGVGFFQPITVLIGWGVLACHLLALGIIVWRDKQKTDQEYWWEYLQRAGWAVSLSSPLVLYTAMTFIFNPFAKIWGAQNLLPSPHPMHYLLAYGMLLPLVVVGGLKLLRENRWRGWLLVSWLLVFPFWVYAPVSIQRRLAEGVWVAMVALVMAAIQKRSGQQLNASQLVCFSITFFTTILLFIGSLQVALNPGMPAFRPIQEIKFFKAIGSQLQPDSIILASFNTSNALPAWIPVRVVIGLGPESVAADQNMQLVAEFYRVDTADAARQDLLNKQGVEYVLFGPEEYRLGDWQPENTPYLSFRYRMGDYSMYEVVR